MRLFRRGVPVALQMSATDCGVACLRMILGFHGRYVTSADVAAIMGGGRDGVTARHIAETAEHFGLETTAYRVPLGAIGDLPLPAVAHWEGRHFVVLEALDGRHAAIVDPASGRRSVPIEELASKFSGTAIAFARGPAFIAEPAPHRVRRTIAGVLRLSRGGIAAALGAGLVAQLLMVAMPLFAHTIIDRVIPRADLSLLQTIGITGTAMLCMLLLVSLVRGYTVVRLQTAVDYELTSRFIGHLMRLPLPFFQSRDTGDLLMRVQSNAVIRDAVSQQLVAVAMDTVMAVVYVVVISIYWPAGATVAAAAGLSQVIIGLVSVWIVRPLVVEEVLAQARTHSFVVECMRGIQTVKAGAAEERILQKWRSLFTTELAIGRRKQLAASATNAVAGALLIATPFLVLLFGARAVMEQTVTIGRVVAFSALVMAFLAPLASLVAGAQRFELLRNQIERIDEVIATPREEERPGDAPRLRGEIALHSVSCRYEGVQEPTVRDVDLFVPAGATIAIVGRSGAGKSTLAKVLAGLLPPSSGTLHYDGIPAEELGVHAIRGQIGSVMQEVFLFNDTVRNNIAFTRPDLPLNEVVRAATTAAVHDQILRWPMKYETRVGESAGNVSGGERQRIALARAVAGDPAILVLDEATSQVDAVTEAEIARNLAALACTKIIVAHRLSTVERADCIVVLQHGVVVEQGTHASLLEQGGVYASLVADQRKSDVSSGVHV